MAAFAVGSPNKVWQNVNNALALGTGANSAFKKQFDALKLYLATQAGNPDLGYYSFVSTGVDDAGGQVLATGVAKVVAVYAKKLATATDVFLWAIDDVDDDSTITTKGLIMLAQLASAEESCYINPTGLAFGLGLTMKAYTTPPGVTDSADTDCPNGFVITRAG